ncbi:MAG: hypothetical protein JWL73_3728 [Actinomycetia bacterium]|nr:hypothetical protein [Actinomycetes bacterium]
MTRQTSARPLLIGEIIRLAALTSPDRNAATLDDDEMTFGELDRSANRLARALADLGAVKGERVCWWGDTTLDVMPVFVALARLGAVFAPVNARLSPDEAREVLELARPALLIVDEGHAPLSASFDVATVDLNALHQLAASHPVHPLGSTAGAGPDTELDENDAHVIFFTSGSTGRSKGVILSHRCNWLRSYPGAQNGAGGGTVNMFPLFHMAGWSQAMGTWQARRPIHLVRSPDARSLLETTERHRATRLYAIPAVWARILEHGVEGYDLSSVREADTGTSAVPPELVARIKAALPHTVTRIFYGSTEAGPAALLDDADAARKPGSVGRAQPGIELKLAENGEVCVRSPFLMTGYFDQPDETARAIDADGWYHSGDLGVFDDEGFLSITGRVRDVIRTGGETVSPIEVEDALRDHPAIEEVAVVGVPDAEWGELVCAVIVTSGAVELEDLRSHCAGKLASFKQPRRVEVVDALPRTAATGQIQRTLIVERIQSQ